VSVPTWKEIEHELLAVADAIEQTEGVSKRAASRWRQASHALCHYSELHIYSMRFLEGDSLLIAHDEMSYGVLQGLLNALPPALSDPGKIAHSAFRKVIERVIEDSALLRRGNLSILIGGVRTVVPAESVYIEYESKSGKAPEPALSKVADVIEKESNGKWMKES
jgi:hypothetical protein